MLDGLESFARFCEALGKVCESGWPYDSPLRGHIKCERIGCSLCAEVISATQVEYIKRGICYANHRASSNNPLAMVAGISTSSLGD